MRDDETIAKAARAFGLAVQLEPEPPLDIYPEHEAAALVMVHMDTQMNLRPMGGVHGYRYEALPLVFRMLSIPRAEQREVYADLRVIEPEVVRMKNERLR